MDLVIASANPDKSAEMREILAGALGDAVRLLPRPSAVPDVEETGETLLDNARLKARAICGATGLPSLADDTGLEVDALGGAPGVYSARYAGEGATYAENVEKLLRELRGVERRAAVFRTVVVVAYPDGSEVTASGEVDGTISPAPRGTGGFGYDPVFVPLGGGGRTYAELSSAEKHELSHRGRAIRALAAILAAKLAVGGASSE